MAPTTTPHSPFRDDVLIGKMALVTGGGTGIGLATARALAQQGADVVIASRKLDHLAPTASGLTAELGRKVSTQVLDLRDADSVDAAVQAILDQHGRIDILVNNGGGQYISSAEHISARGWDAVVDTNLTGTWRLSQAVFKAWMLDHGGTIISVTMLTTRGFPGMAHSVAARAGVEAFSRTLAVEWAPHGVRVNCVAPGIIASSGLKHYPAGLELGRQQQSFIPVKRLGSCDEIAWTIAFLAGPGGAYITGQTLIVDGGRTLWGDTWPLPDPDKLPPVVLPVDPWEHGA